MSAQETAREAWGADIPDWVLVLARECDRTSQNKVAQAIERSGSLVSTVLRRSYKGRMDIVAELVRGTFMAETMDCPALGRIGPQVCRKWRKRAGQFSNVNFQYVQMYRACNACPVHKGYEA